MKRTGAKLFVILALTGMVRPMGQSWAGEGDAHATTPQPSSKLIAIQVLERDSQKPMAGLPVEVIATRQVMCFKAPCPQGEQRKWLGATDAKGVLHFPQNLGIASTEMVVHALGTDAYADVLGYGKHDKQGRPIVLLLRPRSVNQ